MLNFLVKFNTNSRFAHCFLGFCAGNAERQTRAAGADGLFGKSSSFSPKYATGGTRSVGRALLDGNTQMADLGFCKAIRSATRAAAFRLAYFGEKSEENAVNPSASDIPRGAPPASGRRLRACRTYIRTRS